jgi:hypothetical protein
MFKSAQQDAIINDHAQPTNTDINSLVITEKHQMNNT